MRTRRATTPSYMLPDWFWQEYANYASAQRVEAFQLSDENWNTIAALLPPSKRKKKMGRPRMSDRQAMTAILYQLATHCPWKQLPHSFGAPSTVHDRWLEWKQAGVFAQLNSLTRRENVLKYGSTHIPDIDPAGGWTE